MDEEKSLYEQMGMDNEGNEIPQESPEEEAKETAEGTQESPEEEAKETPAEPNPADATPTDYEAWKPLIESLQAQGLNSHSDLQSLMEAKQIEQQNSADVDAQLQQVAAGLQARVNAGSLDVQTANELYAAQEAAIKAQAALTVESRKLDAARQREAQMVLSKLSPDLAKAVQAAGLTTQQMQHLIDPLQKAVGARQSEAVAKYVAAKTADADSSPIPEVGGTAPREAAIDIKNISFADAFKMERSR